MRRRPGFTLIEILIVITIIGILSTLLIIGISKLKVSANRQQTHQLLHNCQALWNEYDASQRLHFDQFELDSPGNVTVDVENQLESNSGGTKAGDRIGLDVALTRALFTQMRSKPNIKAGMDNFPSGRMFLAVTSAQYSQYFQLGAIPWSRGQSYIAGQSLVTYAVPGSGLSPTLYLAITNHVASDGTVVDPNAPPGSPPQPNNAPPNTGCWISLLGDPTVPVLLDAWGNPIIAVPGGVLGDGPVGVFQGVTSNAGYLTAGGSHYQVISPEKRLFFASAGPDGDFSKGDDNLYSFDSK